MDKEQLKSKLIANGYPPNHSVDMTCQRLLWLRGKPAEMLKMWYDKGIEPKFDAIGGIDSNFLKEKLLMKAPAIIIAYAMLLNSPKENSAYFKQLVYRRKEFKPI